MIFKNATSRDTKKVIAQRIADAANPLIHNQDRAYMGRTDLQDGLTAFAEDRIRGSYTGNPMPGRSYESQYDVNMEKMSDFQRRNFNQLDNMAWDEALRQAQKNGSSVREQHDHYFILRDALEKYFFTGRGQGI